MIDFIKCHYSVLKFGVGILDDATKLREDYSLTVRGCVDLRYFAQRCLHRPQAQQVGSLSKLCKTVLDYNLDKSVDISCSDWDSEVLTQEQVTYAAKDACVGREIFYKLLKLKLPNAVSGRYEVKWDTVNGLFKGLVDAKTSGKTLNSVGFNEKPIKIHIIRTVHESLRCMRIARFSHLMAACTSHAIRTQLDTTARSIVENYCPKSPSR